MKLRTLILMGALILVLVGVTGVEIGADSGCWYADYSRAVNDYATGTGWCEGWWRTTCTYCWNTSSPGTCATNLAYPCTPKQLTDTPWP